MAHQRLTLSACLLLTLSGATSAQVSGEQVRLTVMNDQSGHYNSATGPGAVVAARMAAEDLGNTVLGKPINVIALDHQNKPDIGLALARRFLEADGGDSIFDIGNSAISLGVQRLARERGKIVVHIGSIHPDLFGKECSPTGAMWQYDSGALTKGLVQAVTKEGGKDWFIIAVDYTAGKALADDETRFLNETGGKVLGITRHPLGNQDFASQLITASSSGASVLGLASFGADAENLIKQAAGIQSQHADSRATPDPGRYSFAGAGHRARAAVHVRFLLGSRRRWASVRRAFRQTVRRQDADRGTSGDLQRCVSLPEGDRRGRHR